MRWFLRVLGFGLALGLAVMTGLALPVGEHHGITPIHQTRIDSTIMVVGFFLLYWVPIATLVERVVLQEPWKLDRKDDRLPRARVVS